VYPKPCRNCARILRPCGASKEDYPTSEIQHHSKGLCGACYRTPDRVPIEYPRPCEACARLMRPRHAEIDDYPTAVTQHHAHGLCRTCYGYHYHHKKYPSPEVIEAQHRLEELRHENTVAGLNRFLDRIRGKSKVRL
jgi:hypothetical protein